MSREVLCHLRYSFNHEAPLGVDVHSLTFRPAKALRDLNSQRKLHAHLGLSDARHSAELGDFAKVDPSIHQLV
jgi:hypothetical protein